MSQNMGQLKLPSPDGKMRLTDVATTEQLEHELGTAVNLEKRALHFTSPPDELPLSTEE